MSDIGLDAYRLSISWSRLIPGGRGAVNPRGLQYYNNLINELTRNGIQPHVTLHHLDLPQALHDEYGGWLSPKIVEDFTAYADVCFREFGDRVSYWSTINEANVFAVGGYDTGMIAPGRCSNPFGRNCTAGNSSVEPYIVAHHELLAHAAVAKLYREKYKAKQNGWIGIAIYAFWFSPYSNSTEDVAATQRALDFMFGWILHPLIHGDYPESMKKHVGSRLPSLNRTQVDQVKGSIDFIGLNHYSTVYVKDQANSPDSQRDWGTDMSAQLILFPDNSSSEFSLFDLPVRPWGLKCSLEYIKIAYDNHPVFIHENGFGTPPDVGLNDTERVDYLNAYLESLLAAVRNGSNARGYFVWSLIDVFEVLGGYEVSYGLYEVDFKDKALPRSPKLSAHWYSNFLKRNHTSSIKGQPLQSHFTQ
ncbi:beta-glucosidase 22-like isoform X2 [Nymphaea colorata]|nr:beta-glucosidase 22-like isoform X2 [Nymphaea colorata]